MLNQETVRRVLEAAVAYGGDFAELFVEQKTATGIVMLGGKVENALSGKDFGIGLRIFNGFKSIYVYTSQKEENHLIKMAQNASKALMADVSINGDIKLNRVEYSNRHEVKVLPETIAKMQKVELMRRAHETINSYDDSITQAMIRYQDSKQNVLIANTEGKWIEDQRIRTRMAMQSVASKDGEMQTGFYGPGAHKGFEFYDDINIEDYARESARIAVTMLNAEECPSGKMPVIINNEFGGVIFHEACGHSLEATSVAKGVSVFSDKLGEKIAADCVSAIDDGTITNAWGSQNIDDEGEFCKKNILIENGVLKGYLIDKLNGRRMKMDPTGSSRRQSYKYAPTSRMTNTFIAPGKDSIEEMISSTESGIYAKYMGGGSVNPATGDFNFAVMEGYMIENGKITKPVRGATLIGTGSEVLKNIDKVSSDLEHGQGMCGSVSGSLPVNVGQPTIRVQNITVGGRKGE
ncbi:MAG: TldD/PmbA family protein [Tissierellales bacterium]|jgi:TldD protein|nr:TldD/PmbA family protein [Tissierellales bacterium]